MTTQTYGSWSDERPGEGFGAADAAGIPAAAPARMTGWTPAHGEAARFVGECFAVGAVLGVVAELARPVWEKHHG